MKKQIIKINENQLQKVIKESIKKVLNEMSDFDYDCHDYRDWVTTSKIDGYREIERVFDIIKRELNSKYNTNEYNLLYAGSAYGGWLNFINRVRYAAQNLKFKSNNVSDEDKVYIINFVKEIEEVKYPDLSVISNTSGAEKGESVREILTKLYNIINNFIYHFVEKHSNPNLKKQDMDADWTKFDSTRDKDFNKAHNSLENDYFIRDLSQHFNQRRNIGNALRRYDKATEYINNEKI